MDLDHSKMITALQFAVEGEPKRAREVLHQMPVEELDALIDGMDVLLALADEEVIARNPRWAS